MGKDKLTLQSLKEETDRRFIAVQEQIARAVFPDIAPGDFDDLRYRAEAVKEATVRMRVILDMADNFMISDPILNTTQYVDEVLKIASFILDEIVSDAPVTNYNDHYHYDGVNWSSFTPASDDPTVAE